MQNIPSKDLSELVDFPCDFSIKAIGFASDNFAAELVQIFQKTIPEVTLQNTTAKASKGDKYVSITIRFEAQSAEQVKELYADLQAHPAVVMCL